MTDQTPRTAPFGSWKSPITIDALLAGGVGLSETRATAAGVFWLEGRPLEGGRSVLVRRAGDGTVADVTPAGFSVRSRVHEYGGGDYLPVGDSVFFVNDEDQRIYRQALGGAPEPITPEPPRVRSLRYADFCAVPGGRLVCVRETHPETGEAVNELVAIAQDGASEVAVLATGHDFYAHPRISPDGTRLAWIQWDHPNMPWDGTELWSAELGPDGLRDAARVAGGPEESVIQPEWSPDGTLHFVSDRTGWWNLYALRDGAAVALAPAEREFGGPSWVFAQSFYGFLSDGRILCAPRTRGRDAGWVLVDPANGKCEPVVGPHTHMDWPSIHADTIAFVGATIAEPMQVAVKCGYDAAPLILRRSQEEHPGPDCVSPPTHITYATADGSDAHAFFYPPANPAYAGPEGELPPVLVMVHGGPTGAVGSWYMPSLQFWTSRGFAVVDVNYRGSTGYGRPYRDALKGRCGVTEAEDCIHAVRHLAAAGLVDGERALIRGGSAGGAIVLTAVTFHDVFAAGASYYGIGDVELLVADTHKFESRYVDSLIGPYPEARETYIERSPVHFADRVACPVLLLQGDEDKVVPPNQAETFANALDRKGVPHAHLLFEGEGHGFRRADSMRRALAAELSFYAQVLGFTPADDLPPLQVKHL